MPNEQVPDDASPASPSQDRVSILNAIRTPLGFFALVILVLEAMLVGYAVFADPSQKGELMRWAFGLVLMTLVIVAVLVAWRPEALNGRTGQSDGMVHAIGTDICEALRPYLNDIESEKTRREAYETLIALIGNPEDRANRKIRTELARVIRARLKTLGDLKDEA